MAKLMSVFILLQVVFNVGFSMENAAASYQMDLMDSSKLGGSLLENFEIEAQILEQDFSLSSTKIAPKENCDGSYTEILNKIASLATKLNTTVSIELKENWTSNTHVVLDHDGRVIFLTNDSSSTAAEKLDVLENLNYTKEVSFKVNDKLSVKIGILGNNVQNSVQRKSIFSYLINDVLFEFFSNIWFVLKVVLVICTIYVLEML